MPEHFESFPELTSSAGMFKVKIRSEQLLIVISSERATDSFFKCDFCSQGTTQLRTFSMIFLCKNVNLYRSHC